MKASEALREGVKQVKGRYRDQIDADKIAIQFLDNIALKHRADRIEWNNHEKDGRTGSAWLNNSLIAYTVVLRDLMNWSVVICQEVEIAQRLDDMETVEMSNEKELLKRWVYLLDNVKAIDAVSHTILDDVMREMRATFSKPGTITATNEKVNISLLEENGRLREQIRILEKDNSGSMCRSALERLDEQMELNDG